MNEPFKVPRIAGEQPWRAMKRSHFLGDNPPLLALYGPGQRPDAGFVYTPPSDWLPAGFLLRMPQVVWLTPYMPWSYFWTWAVAGFDPDDLTVDYGTADDLDTPNWHSIPNLMRIDFRDIQNRMKAIKARVEKLRANRTWVHITDFLSFDQTGDLDKNPPFLPFDDFGVGAPFFRYAQTGFNHLRAPSFDPNDTPFLGTDFLHCYVGHTSRFEFQSRVLSDEFDLDFVRSIGFDPREESVYVQPRDRILTSAPAFRRFTIWAWGHNQDNWQAWPTQLNPEVRLPTTGFPASFGPNDTIDVWAPAFPSRVQLRVSKSNENLSETLAWLAEDVKNAGITNVEAVYQGEYENLFDEESVVKMIAAHFGFDPDTGRDLPSG